MSSVPLTRRQAAVTYGQHVQAEPQVNPMQESNGTWLLIGVSPTVRFSRFPAVESVKSVTAVCAAATAGQRQSESAAWQAQ